MGLDMYLYAEKHISQYDYKEINGKYEREDNPNFAEANELIKQMPTGEYGSITISKCVAYWRKANAIHGWIVRNCANGVDECQRIGMSREDLIRLRDVCLVALKDRDKATPNTNSTVNLGGGTPEEITNAIRDEMMKQAVSKAISLNEVAEDNPIPPTAGFFFGGTEKDEYYYHYLAETADTINSILASDPEDSYYFYYQASW